MDSDVQRIWFLGFRFSYDACDTCTHGLHAMHVVWLVGYVFVFTLSCHSPVGVLMATSINIKA